MNINPETGFSEASGRSPRFTLWVAYLIFSCITLGSSVQVKRMSDVYLDASAKYAVACSAVTFVATLIAVVMHFVPSLSTLFVGTQIEGALCIVLIVFWAAIVAIITDASDGLMSPDDPINEVQNANLYYFSWAGFFTSVYLMIEYSRAVFGYDITGSLQVAAPRISLWSGTVCSSIIVMGSCARVVRNNCNNEEYGAFSDMYCSRARYGVACGTLSTLAALGIIAGKVLPSLTSLITLQLESATSVFLCIFNTFLVGYITAAGGPGSAIGNLYYFSWVSFLLSLFLLSHCYGEYSGHNADPTAPTDVAASPNPDFEGDNGNVQYRKNNTEGDIEVETFDERI